MADTGNGAAAEAGDAAAPQVETHFGLAKDKFLEMRIGARLDHFARHIMFNGLGRPPIFYAWHGGIFLANYLGFLLLVARVPRPADMDQWSYNMLVFVKLVVWQHLAEAMGCRQGPIHGHLALPNNYKFRLSRGTLKYTLLPALGNKRNWLDLTVHVLWFVFNVGFLLSPSYQMTCIRLLCACDVWIYVFDMSQFYASQGHAYGTMLLSACFSVESGRLAGIQLALIMQYFFSGVGKVGPWFAYVNGPFILQSRIFQGQRWLFSLLFKSPDDLSPTLFGKCAGHFAAGVEYAAPLALVITGSDALVWLGLVGITAMHVYILTMPAPLDVYSWNLCFGLSGIYLFYIASFGFDWSGAASMSPLLAAVLFGEFCLCWYGQFFPDQVGSTLSHRYWAGNWAKCFFLVKKTKTVQKKLAKVKTFSGNPVYLLEVPYWWQCLFYVTFSYLWSTTLNMKLFVRLVEDAITGADGAKSCYDDWHLCCLSEYCCGEFRDQLYTPPLLAAIQEEIGFEAGECLVIRLGAFALGGKSATWSIYDLKTGLVKAGSIALDTICQVDSYPSKSLELML